MTIQIKLNGSPYMIGKDSNITQLIMQLKLAGPLAVEVNQCIVPRSAFATYQIAPNDTIEIVTAIGGG